MRSFNCKSQRVRFVVSVVRIVEQRVELFLFSLWKELFFKFFKRSSCLPYYVMNNCNIRVHKKYNKTFDRFLAHKRLARRDQVSCLGSWIREQSMWCKSEVSDWVNKYGYHHNSTNCCIHAREILPLLKKIIQRLGYQWRKKLSALSTWLIAKKMTTRLCTKDRKASKPDQSN